MKPAGFTLAALLLGVSIVTGQAPVPGVPAQPVPPPAQPASDPKLDTHLNGWETNMRKLENFRFVLELKRSDPVAGDKMFSGVVLCMKPNYAVLRLNYDKGKADVDYEAFICDGKAVFQYDGAVKTVTRWKLPDQKANPGATDNLMLDFLSGMKANDAKARFNLSLLKEDANYVYLDVKPVLAKDKAEFQQLRMALYGPNTKWPYLPAMVYMVKTNGSDTEQWKFKDPQTDIPGLTAKDFQYQEVKGWKFQEGQPPQPQGRPGQPVLPAGGPGKP